MTEDQKIALMEYETDLANAKAKIERLQRCLDSRDDFLVSKGLFIEYTQQLDQPEQSR